MNQEINEIANPLILKNSDIAPLIEEDIGVNKYTLGG